MEKLIQEKLAGYEADMKRQEAAKAHYREIYTAHPDADSIVESRELEEWLAGQNPLVRKAFNDALKDGTAAEVIGRSICLRRQNPPPNRKSPPKSRLPGRIRPIRCRIFRRGATIRLRTARRII